MIDKTELEILQDFVSNLRDLISAGYRFVDVDMGVEPVDRREICTSGSRMVEGRRVELRAFLQREGEFVPHENSESG